MHLTALLRIKGLYLQDNSALVGLLGKSMEGNPLHTSFYYMCKNLNFLYVYERSTHFFLMDFSSLISIQEQDFSQYILDLFEIRICNEHFICGKFYCRECLHLCALIYTKILCDAIMCIFNPSNFLYFKHVHSNGSMIGCNVWP